MNYESKKLEVISTEIGNAVFNGMKSVIVEAVEQEFSNRWEDIFSAVLEANPVSPAAVSNEQYDKLLNDNIEMDAEIVALRAENFQLQMALLGASCKLPDCPVKAQEEAGSISIEEHVQKAVELANEVKIPSLMDELDDSTSEIEDSFWSDSNDDLLLLDDEDKDELLDIAGHIELEEDTLLDSGDDLLLVDDEDPFAVDTDMEDKVLDALSGHEEFDPFSIEADDSEFDTDISVPDFTDEDIPAVPDFEEEEEKKSESAEQTKSTIPTQSPLAPLTSNPVVAPLKKDEVRVVTYQVFDKEVDFVRSNAYLNGVKNKLVRDMAFQLHNVMMQKNENYKTYTPEEREMGKFYTQMVREWGLEIAAANNIQRVKGDDGCAILIAELFYSMHTENQNLVSPVIRSRNEEEKKAAEKVFNQLESNRKLVDIHKGPLALDPMMFVGTKKLDKENTLKAGYALLRARMELTWNNATSKKTECVFPELKKFNMKKGEV